MRKFRVNSGRITGLNGKSFEMNCEVREDQLRSGHADLLVVRGRLTEITDHIKVGEKIKLAIVTSVWKRPEVVEMFMNGIMVLREQCVDFDIKLVVSGSIQDDDNVGLKGFAIGQYLEAPIHNFKYIEIPNEPLAAKVNATTYACRNLNVHYVLCMGSDDIISPELLNEYIPYMRKGFDFIGVTDCYFYDTVSGKSIYWKGYKEKFRKGQTCGAFRALSSKLMSAMDWMPWDHINHGGLDSTMSKKISKIPHSSKVFSMKEHGLFAVDIKSSTNITKFKLWDNSEFIDSKVLLNKFPFLK